MMKTGLLKKVPWRMTCKVAGVALIGAASVMGAMEADPKVQKVFKIIASKVLESQVKGS